MKRSELKNCAVCDKGLMHSGSVAFFRVTLQRMIFDLDAVRELHGLETMMRSPVIANVLGPNRDLADPLNEEGPITILICDDCSTSPHILAAIYEKARA